MEEDQSQENDDQSSAKPEHRTPLAELVDQLSVYMSIEMVILGIVLLGVFVYVVFDLVTVLLE